MMGEESETQSTRWGGQRDGTKPESLKRCPHCLMFLISREIEIREVSKKPPDYGGCHFRGDLRAEATLGWVGE